MSRYKKIIFFPFVRKALPRKKDYEKYTQSTLLGREANAFTVTCCLWITNILYHKRFFCQYFFVKIFYFLGFYLLLPFILPFPLIFRRGPRILLCSRLPCHFLTLRSLLQWRALCVVLLTVLSSVPLRI